jgi:hypothetical protein
MVETPDAWDEEGRAAVAGRGRGAGEERERRRGVLWTEEEHRYEPPRLCLFVFLVPFRYSTRVLRGLR